MTSPYYRDESVTLHAGDALDVLRTLPDNSVDAVVTDPPAGIGFMAKEWDDFRRARNPNDAGRDTVHGRYSRSGPEYGRGSRENFSAWLAEIMREALRVTKPGGHALVWALPRTSHWTACGLEDAGWQIRDRISHLFGQGFSKGRDFARLDFAAQGRDDLAAQWAGWNVALKPGAEDWWLCRRRLEGTVAGNVVRWGTGALNVDGCRIGTEPAFTERRGGKSVGGLLNDTDGERVTSGGAGRWPTNALLDTAAAQQLDRETGVTTSGSRKAGEYGLMGYMGADAAPMPAITGDTGGASRFFPTFAPPDPLPAWRYEPKAPAFERPRVKADGATGRVAGAPPRSGRECNMCGNRTVPPGGAPWPACGHDDWSPFVTEDRQPDTVAHPTVKPLDLIRWLCRLVTPPGGVVLDCFAGSGTTGEAAVVEGFRAILVEREPAYLPLIVARLSKPIQPDLFGGVA
jgi:DNA modification methylase